MHVKQVSDGALSRELIQAGEKVVLVDFFATWCGPCQAVAPAVDKLSSLYPNAVILKMDVDQCPMEMQKYKIQSMPTFIFIRHSKELERITGGDIGRITTTLKKYYKGSIASGGEDEPRRSCKYGSECHKKNDADHRKEFAHSGDSDYHAPNSSEHNSSDKSSCRYGAHCYNHDSDHRKQFSHPKAANNGHSDKEKCRFGNGCTKTKDREHMMKYAHD